MKIISAIVAATILLTPTVAIPQEFGIPQETQREIECLAKNIYYEARGESYKGQLAVAEVTINRAHDPKFPDNICGVVYQKNQFSWTAKKQGERKFDSKSYKKALIISTNLIIMENQEAITDGATFYHNNTVRPYWAKKFVRTASIGRHIFYREI